MLSLTNFNKEQIKYPNNQFEISFNLILLTHIIGDLHQPLHACTLFSSDFPNGNNAGMDYYLKQNFNNFKTEYEHNLLSNKKSYRKKELRRKKMLRFIKKHEDYDVVYNNTSLRDFNSIMSINFHEMWNYMFFKVENNLKIPLNKIGKSIIDFYSDEIMSQFSREKMIDSISGDDFYELSNAEFISINRNLENTELNTLLDKSIDDMSINGKANDILDLEIIKINMRNKIIKRAEIWTKESYNICAESFISHSKQNEILSNLEIEAYYKLSKRRLALSAYRISNILQGIYKIFQITKDEQKIN